MIMRTLSEMITVDVTAVRLIFFESCSVFYRLESNNTSVLIFQTLKLPVGLTHTLFNSFYSKH